MKKQLSILVMCLAIGLAQGQTALFTCDFSTLGVGYSTGTVVGGLEGHSQYSDYATWHQWPNVSSATFTQMESTYPRLVNPYFNGSSNFETYLRQYADTAISSAENGFMMMSLYDQGAQYSGNFNAYILFSGINASNASVLDIQFYQYYKKYYDYCYVDYSTNGFTWNEMEINVRGVDVSVNGTMQGFVSYTLPLAAAGNSDLSVRIRYKSLESSHTVYGYFWIVDDVSIISAQANRIRIAGQEYVEGNYGMIPQGMQINPAWYGLVMNNGAVSQTNVTATIKHIDSTMTNQTTVSSYNNGTITAGSWGNLVCDPVGWIDVDNISLRGWYEHIRVPHGNGIPMPTSTVGDHYLYTLISSDSVTYNNDTIFYNVTSADNNNIYTWAHDNGVLTYSPSNHFTYGYSGAYVSNNSNDVHYYYPGYSVTTRYATGSALPLGWRILGMEIVASPSDGFYETGTDISAVLVRDVYGGGMNNSYQNIATGATIHTVVPGEVNDSNIIGRNSAGYLTSGNYNTIRITFPEQPVLEPLTSYRVGYKIESEGHFAVALANQTSYRLASPTRPSYDTILYFMNDENTRKYSYIPTSNQYQTHVVDTFYRSNGSFYSSSYQPNSYEPMIRMLVGPYRPPLKVRPNDTIMGRTTGSGLYSTGETVTIAAIPNEGYRFAGWHDANTSNPRTIIFSPSDTLYIANFVELPTISISGPTIVGVGDSAVFTASVTPPTATITWSLSGATPSIALGDSVTATWAAAGNYSVVATVMTATDTVRDTLIVTVAYQMTDIDTISYCGNNTALGSVNAGANFYWGIKIPDSMLSSSNATHLQSIQLYVGEGGGTYNLMVCSGTNSAPTSVLFNQNYTFSSNAGYVTCNITSPIDLRGIQNLWVVFNSYYASVCSYVGDTNSNWISFDGISWSHAYINSAYDMSWMIRCVMTTNTWITPSVTINGPSQTLAGVPITLAATAIPTPSTITWSLPGATPSTFVGDSVTVAWTTSGLYNVVATADITTDIVRDTFAVTVLPSCSVTLTCSGTGGGVVRRAGEYNGDRCGTTDYYASGAYVSYDFHPNDVSTLSHLYVNNVDHINDVTTHSSTSGTTYTFGISVTGMTTINAVFDALVYEVSVASADTSMGMVSGGGTYLYNTVALITATPMPHYLFDHWDITLLTDTGDYMYSESRNPLSFNVTEAINIVAYFYPETYTINAISNNLSYGNVTGGGTYEYLSPVVLNASAYSGYRFLMWSNGSMYNPYSFPATEDLDLTAVFVDENDTTIGISSIDNGVDFSLYPNPASDAINISIFNIHDRVTISLIDANGRVVFSDVFECNNDCVKNIKLEHIAQGAYFIQATTPNGKIAIRKLIVK